MKTLHKRAEERAAIKAAAEAAELKRQNKEVALATELQGSIEAFCAQAGISVNVARQGSKVRLQNPGAIMVITVRVDGGNEVFTLDSGHNEFDQDGILDAILDWLKR